MTKPVTANTRDCFSTFVGHKVIGVLFDAFPVMRRDLVTSTKTLIFDDGRGLTIASNGSFWVESPENIRSAVRQREQELRRVTDEITQVLDLTGRPAS